MDIELSMYSACTQAETVIIVILTYMGRSTNEKAR